MPSTTIIKERSGTATFADESVKVVYQAKQTASNRTDIWRPQLANGQLVWLERVHVGPDVNTDVKAWAIKDMDTASGAVKTVLQGFAPGQGGTKLVKEFRFDGQRIAMAESLSKGWQLEIADISGSVRNTIPSSQDVFDVGLVSGGLLYSSGVDDPSMGTIGQIRLWHWTSAGGSTEIYEAEVGKPRMRELLGPRLLREYELVRESARRTSITRLGSRDD